MYIIIKSSKINSEIIILKESKYSTVNGRYRSTCRLSITSYNHTYSSALLLFLILTHHHNFPKNYSRYYSIFYNTYPLSLSFLSCFVYVPSSFPNLNVQLCTNNPIQKTNLYITRFS